MAELGNINLDAHYSKDMKVKRPDVHLAEAPGELRSVKLFSSDEADYKIKQMNNDIYESARKEKAKHDFNRSLYFKIFGGVAIATAGVAGFNKIKQFFKKH